jgi:curli biogenesis system outer membrane secretion channel CsgG
LLCSLFDTFWLHNLPLFCVRIHISDLDIETVPKEVFQTLHAKPQAIRESISNSLNERKRNFMRKIKSSYLSLSLLSLFLVNTCAHSYAQKSEPGSQTLNAPIPISISKFVDKSGSGGCRDQWDWWKDHLGSGFQEMLAAEITKFPRVALYEREAIKQIHEDEHNLVNSEEDQTLSKGKFKKAKYTLVGAVTEFEYCANTKGASINVGRVAGIFGVPAPDLEVGGKKVKAYLKIDLRVINTETGQVVKTITTDGKIEDTNYQLGSAYGDFSSQENSPMTKAAREAIAKAALEAQSALN